MKAQVAATFIALAAAHAAEGAVERAPFVPTQINAPFLEQFTPDWTSRWSASEATKEQKEGEVFAYNGKWSVEEPTVFPGLLGDQGLVAKSKAAQHAISAQFPQPVDPAGKPLVVQYEVKLQNGLSCGGAYLKLLSESPEGIQAQEFSDKTPYTIMFGPDKCGSTNKVHFIFRHKNPITGQFEEKHLQAPPYPKISKTTTLYTLIINPDNTYDILINNDSKKKGSLLEDFEPPVNPSKEIDDPEDKKPLDWVETARIPDPDATKPADWDEDAPAEITDESAEMPEGWLEDEPLSVPDPEAVKPEEWDDEEDGEWLAPMVPNPKCLEAPGCGPWTRPVIPNPAYKGKWSPPMIDNPAYKGVWAPRKINNPAYFEDASPASLNPIGGIGFEIWTMDEDILFDNIYVGHSIEEARDFAKETFDAKLPIEQNREKKENDEAAKAAASASGDWKTEAIEFARGQVNTFVARAREDPIAAVQELPQVAAVLVGAFAALLGFIGLLFGAVGGASSKATKPGKKVDAPSKKSDASAKTTAVQPKEVADAKKRVAAGKADE